ncbi:MAG: septal ring lytic transglycosylase RlpA family protein, partial [Bacteroidota bacterium]
PKINLLGINNKSTLIGCLFVTLKQTILAAMQIIYLLLACFAGTLHGQIIGDIETGKASVFDSKYVGATTSYQATYNPNELVAAHKTYPYNSMVVVKNLDNNREVRVRIIDQGPFVHGRIIEISQAAANQLGMTNQSVTNVQVRLVSMPGETRSIAARRPETQTTARETTSRPQPQATTPEPAPANPATYDRTVATTPSDASPSVAVNSRGRTSTDRANNPAVSQSQNAPSVQKAEPVTQGQFGPGLYQLQVNQGPSSGFGVQVSSMSTLESALDKVIELQGQWFDNIMVKRVGTGPASTYKIILGPWPTRDAADSYKTDLKRRYRIDGFVVPLGEE